MPSGGSGWIDLPAREAMTGVVTGQAFGPVPGDEASWASAARNAVMGLVGDAVSEGWARPVS